MPSKSPAKPSSQEEAATPGRSVEVTTHPCANRSGFVFRVMISQTTPPQPSSRYLRLRPLLFRPKELKDACRGYDVCMRIIGKSEEQTEGSRQAAPRRCSSVWDSPWMEVKRYRGTRLRWLYSLRMAFARQSGRALESACAETCRFLQPGFRAVSVQAVQPPSHRSLLLHEEARTDVTVF